MEKSKLKELEAKLQKLLAQSDLVKPKTPQAKIATRRNVRIIRRPKGQADLQLS